MRQILKDTDQNSLLEKQGFTVLPFLNETEIHELLETFRAISKNELTEFYASSHQKDLNFRKFTNDKIVNAFRRAIEAFFVDVEILGGSFIAKKAKYNEQLQPHQDWNIVDESKFRSFNIWIPLIGTTQENGAIMVMPGSHLWLKNFRHSSIPCAYSAMHQVLFDNMLTLNIKAGEALIYDHALIHASHPNTSENIRIACAAGIKPKEAEMLIYWNNNGQIEEYNCDSTYFLEHNVFERPIHLTLRKTFKQETFNIKEDDFYKLSGIKKPNQEIINNQETRSFFQIYTPLNMLRELKHRLIK
jgi:hypothetical protein